MPDRENSLISFDQLVEIVRNRSPQGRSITALAGPPASGKSYLSRRLESALNEREKGSAAVLEMDGYHFDDWVLVPCGLLARKGAPETFDVAGFAHMLKRLRANEEQELAVPIFDRKLEIARAGAGLIPHKVRHLIVEGNYLLLDREPWNTLFPFFDITVFIEVDEQLLEHRLVDRWRSFGLSDEETNAKVHGNDLVNAKLVIAESRQGEFQISGS